MQRSYIILIAGALLISGGLILILPSAYTTSSLLNSISSNDLIKSILTGLMNNTQQQPASKDSSLSNMIESGFKKLIGSGFTKLIGNDNQYSSEELRNLGYNLGLNFFIILVGIILMVNGLISLIGGTIIFVFDRRKIRQPKV